MQTEVKAFFFIRQGKVKRTLYNFSLNKRFLMKESSFRARRQCLQGLNNTGGVG